jgi:hypothetical protein
MNSFGTQKSIFGGGQSDIEKIGELLNDYNLATAKLPDVKTVQDIIVITNSLSKLIKKTTVLNAETSLIKSK